MSPEIKLQAHQEQNMHLLPFMFAEQKLVVEKIMLLFVKVTAVN